jgi:hypothetical protein
MGYVGVFFGVGRHDHAVDPQHKAERDRIGHQRMAVDRQDVLVRQPLRT